ncbi:MAG: hypothetical protein ABIN18_09020 [Pseudomonadota bacterium]
MRNPNHKGRSPQEIISCDVYHDQAGYVYQGLSWIDYAKRETNILALRYAALSTRLSIESLIFEEIILCVGNELDRQDYGMCKGSKKKLYRIFKKLNPNYKKLVIFTDTLLSFIGSKNVIVISWDFDRLLADWDRSSNYLHWRGVKDETTDSIEWFHKGISVIDDALNYIWENLTKGYSAILRPASMTPEVLATWEEYKADRIDISSVERRLRLAQPILQERYNRTSQFT